MSEFKHSLWTYGDSVSGWKHAFGDSILWAHLADVATMAGSDLGYPANLVSADFWQHCIFLYFLETGTEKIVTSDSEGETRGAMLEPLKA
jgi:hypothetical protein